MNSKSCLLAISGPTGSGKTNLAEEVATASSALLFNADSFQFYKEIPILSNQPTSSSNKIKYIAFRNLNEPLNAGEFSRMLTDDLKQSGVWAGTGLYLGATLYGLDESGTKGTPFQGEPRCAYKMIVLNPDRADLYAALDKRVDHMLELGAIDEAKKINEQIKSGALSETIPTLKAIGLQHLLWFLNEKYDWKTTVDLWKRDTRRLAKRQWTWLRKFCRPSENTLWLDPKNISVRQILDFWKESSK